MAFLEFVRGRCDFRRMMADSIEHFKKDAFPEDVMFWEPQHPADYKHEIFKRFPEDQQQALERGASLIEKMHERIDDESENGT